MNTESLEARAVIAIAKAQSEKRGADYRVLCDVLGNWRQGHVGDCFLEQCIKNHSKAD